MRLVVLFAALSMPLIAWLSDRGLFGPDVGTVSDRHPTLLVAAGYAFAIWGLIFVLDVAWGLWQATLRRRRDRVLDTVRRPAVIGFVLTASWMVVFPMEVFWLALAIIWAALACVTQAWLRSLSAPASSAASRGWAPWTLGLHAGWLSVAAFLNTAQVVVAYELLPVGNMLPWTAVLWAGVGALVLGVNRLACGQLAYVAAALWGLLAVVVEQSASPRAGAGVSAAVAAALAALLLAQTAWLHWQRHDAPRHAF